MNGLALCSGIGGFDLGLKRIVPQYRTVCHVEGEAYAAAVLVARMEDKTLDQAPIWSNVRTFDARPWRGKVDILTGGYPCQPFSLAGKQLGEQDPRHLWPEFKRIIGECRPGLVFCENVSAHLRNGFDTVVRDMDQMGYELAAGVFTAWAVGAPHIRERLFWLGVSSDTDSRRRESERKQEQAGEQGSRRREPDGCDPDRVEFHGASPWEWGQAPSPIHGVDDGPSNRVDRLRACGNAVVPAVVSKAFETLWRIDA